MDKSFLISQNELKLSFTYDTPEQAFRFNEDDYLWKKKARKKLLELLSIADFNDLNMNEAKVRLIREKYFENKILVKAVLLG